MAIATISDEHFERACVEHALLVIGYLLIGMALHSTARGYEPSLLLPY